MSRSTLVQLKRSVKLINKYFKYHANGKLGILSSIQYQFRLTLEQKGHFVDAHFNGLGSGPWMVISDWLFIQVYRTSICYPRFPEGIRLTTQSGVTNSIPILCQATGCGLMLDTEDKPWTLVAKWEALGCIRTVDCAAARGTAFQVPSFYCVLASETPIRSHRKRNY